MTGAVDEGFSLADEMDAFGNELDTSMLPAGPYELIVHAVKPKLSGGGKPQLVVTYHVVGGQYEGRSVTDWLTWSSESADAARIFTQTLTKLGASQKWIKETRASMEVIAIRITGTRVKATLSQDQVRDRNKVSLGATVALGPNAQSDAALDTASVTSGAVQLSSEPLSEEVWDA